MIEINPKENTTLTFQVDISGTTAAPKPRLIVPLGEGLYLAFEGTVNEGTVEVDIAELLALTEATEFDARLEVVVEDSIFTPWAEKVVINKPKEVKANPVKIEEKKIVVSAEKATKSGDVATPIPVEESEEKPERKVIGEYKPKSAKDLFGDKL